MQAQESAQFISSTGVPLFPIIRGAAVPPSHCLHWVAAAPTLPLKLSGTAPLHQPFYKSSVPEAKGALASPAFM